MSWKDTLKKVTGRSGQYKTEELRDKVLELLDDCGAYVVNEGQANSKYRSSPSIYIKFADSRVRSLRIGDHDGYERYKYKWNLRTDIREHYRDTDNGCMRFYYPEKEVEELCKHIRNYYNKIVTNYFKEFNSKKV